MCNGYFTRFLITNNYSYYLGVDISKTISRFDRSPIANQSLNYVKVTKDLNRATSY